MQVGASELSPSLPLSATKREQRELSGKLIVKPLKDIIGRTAFTQLHEGKAELQVTDKIFAPFFNPDTSGREYYQDGDTLIVKEDIPSSKIYALAVFEKSNVEGQGIKNPRIVTFKHGDVDGKIEYLKVKNFCLVKENEEAIDVAASWYSQSESSGLTRRIGLLKYNPSLSKNQAGAVVRENSILLTDTQDEVSYNMRDAIGIRDTPPISRWLGTILAGVKSTQQGEDLTTIGQDEVPKPLNLVTDDGFQEESIRFIKSDNVLEDALATVRIRAITKRLSPPERILYSLITSIPSQQRKGFYELIRIERNAVASTLYLIRQLRHMGFDLFPDASNSQLIQTTEEILKKYDESYPHASKYGLQFTSLGEVNLFVLAMKRIYDDMKSSPDFDGKKFVEMFKTNYENWREKVSAEKPSQV